LAVLSLAVSVEAQERGRGRGGQGFGGGGFGGGGPLQLLQRRDVQEELELLDDQKQQITALAEKSRERAGEAFRRGGDGDRAAALATLQRFNEETQAEINKILLPHQAKRLSQIEVQSRMRFSLAPTGQVADQLGLSESDQDKLREKAQGLEQELAKKTAEIRRQLQEQLMAEMSPDQRTKFKEMLGEPFTFRDEPGRGGFGGFGGGRGGDGQRGRRGQNN
jgi:hypothetical protein